MAWVPVGSSLVIDRNTRSVIVCVPLMIASPATMVIVPRKAEELEESEAESVDNTAGVGMMLGLKMEEVIENVGTVDVLRVKEAFVIESIIELIFPDNGAVVDDPVAMVELEVENISVPLLLVEIILFSKVEEIIENVGFMDMLEINETFVLWLIIDLRFPDKVVVVDDPMTTVEFEAENVLVPFLLIKIVLTNDRVILDNAIAAGRLELIRPDGSIVVDCPRTAGGLEAEDVVVDGLRTANELDGKDWSCAEWETWAIPPDDEEVLDCSRITDELDVED